jgi:ankyrin repeat protein
MMVAAKMGHSNVVDILIKAGADIHVEAGDGLTAAKLARASGHLDTLALLNAAGAN